MTVFVTLSDLHLDYCAELARRRQLCAVRHNRKPGNGAPTDHDRALRIQEQGIRGECAAYLWLKPIKWHAYQEQGISDLPDLGSFIDVKTVMRPNDRLIVLPSARDEWAYLLVNGCRHPVYAIEGWMWGHEAKVKKYLRDPVGGREAFFIPARDLKPPADLLADLKKFSDLVAFPLAKVEVHPYKGDTSQGENEMAKTYSRTRMVTFRNERFWIEAWDDAAQSIVSFGKGKNWTREQASAFRSTLKTEA